MSLLTDEFVVTSAEDGSYLTVQRKPYESHRSLNCKLRWRGKTLFEIFCTEFKLDAVYVKTACDEGRILLNKSTCEPESVVINGDVIDHRWLATEPEIFLSSSSHFPHIILQDEHVIAAYKPHGLPTGPQGKFFYTNLVSIIKTGLNLDYLQPVNRLDRAVAGVVIFATDADSKVSVVKKRYIAKVSGRFSDEINQCCAKLLLQKHIPDQILKTVIDEEAGIDAWTMFRYLGPDDRGTCSFVEANPITGRTHQIRAHLAHLGHPIVGDRTYDGSGDDKLSQPDLICLFSYEYWICPKDGKIVKLKCRPSSSPSWLPQEIRDQLDIPS
jgi:RluA family pseudouridine synthase